MQAILARFTVHGAYGFWEIAQAEPARPAIVDSQGNTTTYGELLAPANRLAHGLSGLGLTTGDAAAILLPNEPSFLAGYDDRPSQRRSSSGAGGATGEEP